MIIYDLCCNNGHRFEGWFRSADDFQQQSDRHLVSCPQCDSHDVRRVPSAVAIGSGNNTEPATSVTKAGSSHSSTALMPAGTEVMALYRQLVQAIANSSEDVGASFADEARKIHYNEAPERPIRGKASRGLAGIHEKFPENRPTLLN